MDALLGDARNAALNAIDRRRDESSVDVPPRAELDSLAPRQLRHLASDIRARAWGDETSSAEESENDFNDLGWAPSAALRAAALIDHLAELSFGSADPTGTPASTGPAIVIPSPQGGAWNRMTVQKLEEQFDSLSVESGEADVLLFDAEEKVCIARATSWRGEIVELVDLTTLPQRRKTLQAILQGSNNSAKPPAKAATERLAERETAWAEACVRAGYARPHFGPDLTAEFFQRHVVGRERLDISVDLNAIVNGIVHHIARVAPHVDFARSLITDLEIQRLGDHDKATWRKSVRTLESLPVAGPVWRSLGHLDPTALLVARSEQKGKAPGADALMVHNFETALLRASGVRSVLLTCDNGLARSVASRLPNGTIWVGYVDAIPELERFVSPLLAWPRGEISASHYSSLSRLVDEVLVCGVSSHVIATDGRATVEVRAHLEGEHQFVRDWLEPRLFVQGISAPRQLNATPADRWPLRRLEPPAEPRSSGARVTVEQVATAMEWIRGSIELRLERVTLPLKEDAQREVWTFLKAVGLVDNDGVPTGRASLVRAAAQHDVEWLRETVLQFEPVAKIVGAVAEHVMTVADAKKATDLGERTFSAALMLAVAAGLVWRANEEVGAGHAFVERDAFRSWLTSACVPSARISQIALKAASELKLSVPRFRDALEFTVADPLFSGTKGGSTETHPLDCKVFDVDEEGRIAVEELQVDDLLGLRSLTVRS